MSVHAGEDGVVVPLETVLTDPGGVDEAEQVGRERIAGNPRGVVHALLGGNRPDAAQPERLELVIDVLRDRLGEIVELIGLIQGAEDLCRAQLQDRGELTRNLGAIGGRHQRRVGEDVEHLDVADQHASSAVEDHAAGGVQADRRRVRLRGGPGKRPALDDLDLDEPAEDGGGHAEKGEDQPQPAAAKVGCVGERMGVR